MNVVIGYDYSRNGWYFVTVCTGNKEMFFGDVVNYEMCLNEIGDIAKQYWLEIPQHFKNIKLDEFVVMPNHLHGILVIGNNENVNNIVNVAGRDVAVLRLYEQRLKNNKLCYKGKHIQMSKISPKPGSLSTIVRSYKSIVTCESKTINPNFFWQPRFHDHITHNQKSLNQIRQYIKNNPKQWYNDRNYVLKILR